MIPTWKIMTVALLGLALAGVSSSVAEAQIYQTYYAPAPVAYQSYYAPTTAYYAPTTAAHQTYYAPATAAVAPVAYQTYRPATGWYPGYWLDRTRNWLFRRPVAVTAAYPTTYAASYPASYTASYPTTYAASYPAATYGAAPACTSCAPAQQVTMRPICESACSDCGVSSVIQSGYTTSPACSNCSTNQVISSSAAQSPSPTAEYEPTPASPTQTFGGPSEQPRIPPGENVPTDRNRPVENSTEPDRPKDAIDELLDEGMEKQGSYFQAPELFDPKDTTVQWSPAPVRTAVYQRPAGQTSEQVSARPITWEKAKRDSVGWTSASK